MGFSKRHILGEWVVTKVVDLQHALFALFIVSRYLYHNLRGNLGPVDFSSNSIPHMDIFTMNNS
jgi:hypothetical protein